MKQSEIVLGLMVKVRVGKQIRNAMVISRHDVRAWREPYYRVLWQVEVDGKVLARLRDARALHPLSWEGGTTFGKPFLGRPQWDGKGENHTGADQ